MPTKKTNRPPVVFLLHGYGSNEDDLLDLYKSIPNHFLVISVRAPYTISKGSYKWFDVDFSSTDRKIDSLQLSNSVIALKDLLSKTKALYKYNEKEVYLGGFSQGGILSYHMGLTLPEFFKGIVIFSGRLLDETKNLSLNKNEYKKLKILILHGKNDNVIRVEKARLACNYFSDKKMEYTYQEFNIQHSISEEELRVFEAWLKKS